MGRTLYNNPIHNHETSFNLNSFTTSNDVIDKEKNIDSLQHQKTIRLSDGAANRLDWMQQ